MAKRQVILMPGGELVWRVVKTSDNETGEITYKGNKQRVVRLVPHQQTKDGTRIFWRADFSAGESGLLISPSDARWALIVPEQGEQYALESSADLRHALDFVTRFAQPYAHGIEDDPFGQQLAIACDMLRAAGGLPVLDRKGEQE